MDLPDVFCRLEAKRISNSKSTSKIRLESLPQFDVWLIFKGFMLIWCFRHSGHLDTLAIWSSHYAVSWHYGASWHYDMSWRYGVTWLYRREPRVAATRHNWHDFRENRGSRWGISYQNQGFENNSNNNNNNVTAWCIYGFMLIWCSRMTFWSFGHSGHLVIALCRVMALWVMAQWHVMALWRVVAL